MSDMYAMFEHFSRACGVGLRIKNLSGEALFSSTLLVELSDFTGWLFEMLDCTDSEEMAILYGVYQARRFDGRYMFIAPSGFTYCISQVICGQGELMAGAVAGPFLMTSHEEYLAIDIVDRYKPDNLTMERLIAGIEWVPYKSTIQARSINEQLFLCASQYGTLPQSSFPAQPTMYRLGKKDELLAAISKDDIHTARHLLNDILGQVLFDSGNDFETLRSRVFELILLLSRAALQGGGNIDAIFGLEYAILREIDELCTKEDAVHLLYDIMRRFRQQVFDFTGTKRSDIINKAIEYMKVNYMEKITLQDIANHVFLSPTYFSKVFKDETGQPPIGFLTAVRIDASKRLLRDPAINIAEISGMVGFESQSYFTRVFKKTEKQTPNDYRLCLRHSNPQR